MQTNQQGLGAENTEKADASIDRCAGSNENLDASRTEKTGTSFSLPEPRRWVPHRKAEVVAAVRGGFISLDEARKRYALSIEEYLTWQREIDLSGLAGLQMNRTQQRRRAGPRSTDR
ncbi:MAG: DUF1153 domain-containing protein [Rhizomicrobium sp.]|jgi:hypothetical protein